MHQVVCSFRKIKSVFCSFRNDPEAYNTGQILYLAMSHQGDRMVTGSSDGLIKVFDCFSVKLLVSIDPQIRAISLLILSKDDRFLVVSDSDCIIHVYDFRNYAKLAQINNLRNSEILAMDFSKPGEELFLTVCTHKHGLWVYRSSLFDGTGRSNFEEGSRLLLPFIQWTCCEVSAVSGTINAIDIEGTLHSWPTLPDLFEPHESVESVSKIVFDNRYRPEILLFNDYSQIILLYNKSTHFFIRVEGENFTIVKEERYSKLNPKSHERGVVVNQNKRFCFIVVNDERRKEDATGEIGTVKSKIYMYEYISDVQVRSITKINENNSVMEMNTNIFMIETHPTFPNIFLTGDYEGQIILWDVSQGTVLKVFKETFNAPGYRTVPNPIMEAQFFPSGLQFVVSTYYGMISVFSYGACHDVSIQPDEQFFEQDLMSAPQTRIELREQEEEEEEDEGQQEDWTLEQIKEPPVLLFKQPDEARESLRQELELEIEKYEDQTNQIMPAKLDQIDLHEILEMDQESQQENEEHKEVETENVDASECEVINDLKPTPENQILKENSDLKESEKESQAEKRDVSESDKENEHSQSEGEGSNSENIEIVKDAQSEYQASEEEESEEDSEDRREEMSNMIGLNNLTLGNTDRGLQIDQDRGVHSRPTGNHQIPTQGLRVKHARGYRCDSSLKRVEEWNVDSENVYFEFYQQRLKDIKYREQRLKEEGEDIQNGYMDVYFREKERLKTGFTVDSEMPLAHHLVERMGLGFRKRKKNKAIGTMQGMEDDDEEEDRGRRIITRRRRRQFEGESDESSGEELEGARFRVSERRRRQMARRLEDERRRREEEQQEEQRRRAERRRRERLRHRAVEAQPSPQGNWDHQGVMTRSQMRARDATLIQDRDRNDITEGLTPRSRRRLRRAQVSESEDDEDEDNEEEEDDGELPGEEAIRDEDIEQLEEDAEEEELEELEELEEMEEEEEEDEEEEHYPPKRVSLRLMKKRALMTNQNTEEFGSIASNIGRRRRRNRRRDLRLIDETDEHNSPASKDSQMLYAHTYGDRRHNGIMGNSYNNGNSPLTRFASRRERRKASMMGLDGNQSLSQHSDTLNGKESVASFQHAESKSKPKECSFCRMEIEDSKRKRKCCDCARVFHLKECLGKVTHRVNHSIYCLDCYMKWKAEDINVKECVELRKFQFSELNRRHFEMTSQVIHDNDNPGAMVFPVSEQGKYILIPEMFRLFATHFAEILPPDAFSQNLDLLMIAKRDLQIIVYETALALPKMRFKYESQKFSDSDELFIFQSVRAKILNCNVNELRAGCGLRPIAGRDPCLIDFAYVTAPDLEHRFLVSEAQYEFLLEQLPQLGADNVIEDYCGESYSVERVRHTPETFYDLLELTPSNSEFTMTRNNRRQMITRGHPQYLERLSSIFQESEKTTSAFQKRCLDFPAKFSSFVQRFNAIFHYFERPVDKVTFNNYLDLIPVEMNLELIFERLRNQFYLSKAGLETDLRLIEANALKYNSGKSPVTTFARFLVEILVFLIDNEYSPEELAEIEERYQQLAKTGVDPERIDEVEENEQAEEPQNESPNRSAFKEETIDIQEQQSEDEQLANSSISFRPRSDRLKIKFQKPQENNNNLIGKRQHSDFKESPEVKMRSSRRRLMRIKEIQHFKNSQTEPSPEGRVSKQKEQNGNEGKVEDEKTKQEAVEQELYRSNQNNPSRIRTRRRKAFERKQNLDF